jgi:hypothetical protein
VSTDVPADGRLDNVAAKLVVRGLFVRVPIDVPLSPDDPDADSIWVHNPASGQYAQIGYVSSGLGSGDACLELTYQTAPDEDPDGAQMADRVDRLLSAGPSEPPARAAVDSARAGPKPTDRGERQSDDDNTALAITARDN